MRVVFILINTFIIFRGTNGFNVLLPATVLVCLVGIIINTYQIQKKLWRLDMQAKESKFS